MITEGDRVYHVGRPQRIGVAVSVKIRKAKVQFDRKGPPENCWLTDLRPVTDCPNGANRFGVGL